MKIQNVEEFQRHAAASRSRGLQEIYLIVIPDDFERRRWMDRIAASLLSPDQSLVRWSAAENSFAVLCSEMQSLSLFGPDPVTWIDEVEKLPKKQAQEFVECMLQGHFILGARSKSVLYSSIEKRGVILDLSEEKVWEKERRLTQQLADRVRQAGKRISPDALQWLSENGEKDLSFLEKEIDKLICFTASRPSIELADVVQICVSSRKRTLWQLAEEMVWEGKWADPIDDESFHGFVPALRHQLQLGRKISSFLAASTPFPDIRAKLPKVWPKILEKRLSQAAHLGPSYFQKGLELLFSVESLSRAGSTHALALLDWFQSSLCSQYGKWKQ